LYEKAGLLPGLFLLQHNDERFEKVRRMTNEPAPFPLADLHAAAPDAAEQIEALKHELDRERPDPERISDHVATLRGHGGMRSVLESWYLDEHTQAFLSELNSLGL
jgi:hypothetical protein